MPTTLGPVGEQGDIWGRVVDLEVIFQGCNGIQRVGLTANTNIFTFGFCHLGERKVANVGGSR